MLPGMGRRQLSASAWFSIDPLLSSGVRLPSLMLSRSVSFQLVHKATQLLPCAPHDYSAGGTYSSG